MEDPICSESCLETLRSYTIPIFRDVEGVDRIHGTGVIVRLNDQALYLVTAHHVLETTNGELLASIYIPSCLDGMHIKIVISDCKGLLCRHLDIAVIRYPMEFLPNLKGDYCPVPRDCLLRMVNESLPVFFCGYPGGKNKVNLKTLQLPEQMYAFRSNSIVVANDGIHIETPWKGSFDANGSRLTPPKFSGISGGGIFQVENTECSPYLVGIALGPSNFFSEKARKRKGVEGITWDRIVRAAADKLPGFSDLLDDI